MGRPWFFYWLVPAALSRVARLDRAYRKERSKSLGRLQRDARVALEELRPSRVLLDRIVEALAAAASKDDLLRVALASARVHQRTTRRALARLVNANLRLVISVATRYRGRGLPLIDLVQEGNLGLVKAVDRFDHRRGYRLATFATWWIRQSISRALDEKSRAIRVPSHMLDTCGRVAHAGRRFANRSPTAPTHEELADATGLPVEKVVTALAAHHSTVSLDAEASSGEAIGDRLEDPRAEVPFDAAATRRFEREARELLHVLDPREREIVCRRFGLEGRAECTLQEIGRSFALTRERVRQIEHAALQKLRAPRRAHALRSDLAR